MITLVAIANLNCDLCIDIDASGWVWRLRNLAASACNSARPFLQHHSLRRLRWNLGRIFVLSGVDRCFSIVSIMCTRFYQVRCWVIWRRSIPHCFCFPFLVVVTLLVSVNACLALASMFLIYLSANGDQQDACPNHWGCHLRPSLSGPFVLTSSVSISVLAAEL